MTKEMWKTVDGHPEYYVSNFGRVKKNGSLVELKENGNYQGICGFWMHH